MLYSMLWVAAQNQRTPSKGQSARSCRVRYANRHTNEVTFRPLTSAELPPLSADADSQLSSDMKLLHQCARCVVTGDGSSVAHRIHGQLSGTLARDAEPTLAPVYVHKKARY